MKARPSSWSSSMPRSHCRLPDDVIVLERGSIVHRARSEDLLKDQATLDRLIGLRLMERA